MRKRLSSIPLLFALTLLVALTQSGCGSKGDEQPKSSADAEGRQEETINLKVAFPSLVQPKDLQLVQDELNKLTKSKMNATVTLMPISSSNWSQQMNLMLSSNEELDLTFSPGDYSLTVGKGQLQDITELLDQYGSGIKEALGDDILNAMKINGKIYGVPTNRNMGSGYGFALRKDLLEKHQINVDHIKEFNDLEPVLKLIKDQEPGVTPITTQGAGGTFVDFLPLGDSLGDSFGILPNYDNDLKVVNQYEMPEYAERLKTVYKWYQEGYILKDIATTQTMSYDLYKANALFATAVHLPPSFVESTLPLLSGGGEYIKAELSPPVVTTNDVTMIMWGIPNSAKDADRSMQFLNLMYSDPEIVNMLNFGIEGKHYVKVEGTDNVIDFPEGLNASNNPYYWDLTWLFGNSFLSYVRNGEDPDKWKQVEDFNQSTIKSKALGFAFDSTPVKAEITALTNVMNQYKKALETGILDPEKYLPEFNAKLKGAGIDRVIAEKQKQLDDWVQQNQ
ncbi:ABC transporter substrate-binding protein [Paenibacillus lautus]|uniref:ABC transporter substrate-binding protein n=1 Tax=Paenibacillus lautus TaxID=1401 RepID=UPI003D9AADD0